MQVLDFEAKWNAYRSRTRIYDSPLFEDGELLLGARTRLASIHLDQRGKSAQPVESRLVALLCVAYGRPISDLSLAHLRRAIEKRARGDTLLASLHLALTGFGRLDRPVEAAYRLFTSDELMRAGVEPRDILRGIGLDTRLVDSLEKYTPDQPRVPAGNGRSSGQWMHDENGDAAAPKQSTESGATSRSETFPVSQAGSTDRHEPTTISATTLWPPQINQVLSDAPPDPIRLGEQYAQIAISKIPRNGNPQIDRTTDALVDILASIVDSVQKGAGPLYGIAVHMMFANAVRAQNLPGIGIDGVEQSFNATGVVRCGLDGSIRTDVALWNDDHTSVIAIYDLKTGAARLSDSRVQQLRNTVAGDRAEKATVFELRVDRHRPD